MKQKEVIKVLVLQVFKKIFFFLLFFFITLNVNCVAINNKLITDIENYFNSISYLKANFLQDDVKNYKLSEGVFYLHRPNKLRIDYTNPFSASLYVDEKTTIYYDKELDEIHSLRTADTPLTFFLKKKISLKNKYFKINSLIEYNKYIELTLMENKKNEKNLLILKFEKNPISLLSMTIKTDNQEINMKFLKKSFSIIDNSIFNYNKLIKK